MQIISNMTKAEWENRFNQWRQPLSATEESRCQNAERMVREALKADAALANRTIEVFLQGSYRNNTNVRTESDIDICVRLMDVFFADLPPGTDNSFFGLRNVDNPTYSEYKDEVIKALVAKFGNSNVNPGNKAVIVEENSYRIHVDVVICFEHRSYFTSGSYNSGVEFWTLDGKKVVNFPKQHIENGILKNNVTGHQYKRVARILKTLNALMDGINSYKKLPSFFIECLAWNVSNSTFESHSTYYDEVRAAIIELHDKLQNAESDDWTEVSGLLWLFKGHTKWTKQDALNFLVKAWNHAEFAQNG